MQSDREQQRVVYIARQPILDHGGQVFGYELLYRARETDSMCTVSGDVASASVFTDGILTMGLEMLTNGRPAFVNLTRSLLLNKGATVLPAPSCILEIGREVAIDDGVIEACRQLHGKPNVARSILNAVIAYERGDFDAAAALAEGLGLRAETLAAAYSDALRYARELSRDVLAA